MTLADYRLGNAIAVAGSVCRVAARLLLHGLLRSRHRDQTTERKRGGARFLFTLRQRRWPIRSCPDACT
jgi:hypothetical protein